MQLVKERDGCRWSADEVQVLITLWAQPNIQKQLLASEENDEVFTYLSDELAQVGFAKSPQQCSLKVDRLKKEYAKLKQEGANANDKSDWFAIMDSVLFPEGEASKERNLSAVLTASNPPEGERRCLTAERFGEKFRVCVCFVVCDRFFAHPLDDGGS
uniref:Myb/SANT-like DNA-binding domain-containing protein n=1 Tax=Poecilia reticulata TaxID=8081 RepID=A0A3P9P6J4_POERE